MTIYELYTCDEWRSNITLNSRIMATIDLETLESYIYDHIDEYSDNIPEYAREDSMTLIEAIKNQEIEYLHLNIVEDGEVTN